MRGVPLEAVVGDAGARGEGDAQVVGEVLGLFEDRGEFLFGAIDVCEWPGEEIVSCGWVLVSGLCWHGLMGYT